MPRIRSVKPEFWSSPSMEGLNPWVRLLYIAMWNWADDHGRGTANPRELMGFAFPYDDFTVDESRRLLGETRRVFGVVFYTVAGRQYYEIPSWSKHQRIDKRWKSRHPGPDEGTEYDPTPPDLPSSEDSGSLADTSRESHASPAEHSAENVHRNRGTGEQGSSAYGGRADAPPHPTPAADDDPPRTAQTLVAEWIDQCGQRPPARVVGHVARELGNLLDEGIDYDTVRAGLAQWHRRRLNPAALASVVHEVSLGPPEPRRRATSDQRVGQGMDLVAKYEALENGTRVELTTGAAP